MNDRTSMPSLRAEHGYTLIELLVGMVVALIVSLAAFMLMEFTTVDVTNITDRIHVNQVGRTALQKIMLQLHSACVAVNINPIQKNSNEKELIFISETSPVNASNEPVSSLATVGLHKIIYTPASGSTEGTLKEKYWTSTGTSPEYKFNLSETPSERLLLKGVKQVENGTEKVPAFQYYRYYKQSDTEAKLGKINPKALTKTELEKENSAKETEAEKVAKVTVSFALAPEGKESIVFKSDRLVAFEDSAVLRMAPSSEEVGVANPPCSET